MPGRTPCANWTSCWLPHSAPSWSSRAPAKSTEEALQQLCLDKGYDKTGRPLGRRRRRRRWWWWWWWWKESGTIHRAYPQDRRGEARPRHGQEALPSKRYPASAIQQRGGVGGGANNGWVGSRRSAERSWCATRRRRRTTWGSSRRCGLHLLLWYRPPSASSVPFEIVRGVEMQENPRSQYGPPINLHTSQSHPTGRALRATHLRLR